MKIFRSLYNWTLDKSSKKSAKWFLCMVSFAESSFFPIPPDIILIPMVLAKRTKAFFMHLFVHFFSNWWNIWLFNWFSYYLIVLE